MQPSAPPQERQPVLLLGPDERTRTLAGRLSLLGCCRGVRAEDSDGALRAQAAAPQPFTLGFVASDHGLRDLGETLRLLGEHGAGGKLRWVAFGPRPGEQRLGELRRAGVRLALFDPASDDELRFVLNRALHEPGGSAQRHDDRVPADLPARVVTKNGEKVALIYNLSSTGAYVATPRPTLRGGTVRLQFALPSATIALDAQVVWNNVPGNLRRHNAPIGMGLRFLRVPPEIEHAILTWVEQRIGSYQL